MLLSLLVWCTAVLGAAVGRPSEEDILRKMFDRETDARGTFVNDGSAAAPFDDTAPTCTMDATDRCAISEFDRDVSTLVRPGGNTRCIFERSGPYQFEVIRGDADKLLVFFQGGGACWDVLSTAVAACSTGAFPQGTRGGVFERTAQNPFKNYTIVHLLYCDGSLFNGNVTRPYLGAKQSGFANAKSGFDWIVENMRSPGGLAPRLSSLVISGCSAGSIGAQLWADHALTTLPHDAAAVVPDSYMGVFPTSAEGHLIEQYGMCTTPLLEPLPELRAACAKKQLSLHALTAAVTARHPKAVFGQVQSKTDEVQMGFNWALSADPLAHPGSLACGDPTTCWVDGAKLYGKANDYLEGYNIQPNHVHFLVQSSQHCYLPNGHFYDADPSGASAGGRGGEPLHHWMARLPLRPGTNISTRCVGEAMAKGSWTGTHYCDAAMVGKVIVA